MPPPGNCSDGEHKELEDAKDKVCDRVRRCKHTWKREDLAQMGDLFDQCAYRRKKIMDTCFMGGNDEHQRQLRSIEEGRDYCRKILKKSLE